MTALHIQVLADLEAVSTRGAEEFLGCAQEAIAQRGRFLVALTGGSTPRRLYQMLAEDPLRTQLDWGRVQFFWGDERCVPPDHADSNYRMAHEALLSQLSIGPEQVHRMEGERPDLDQSARDYQNTLARVFGVASEGEPPAFDLILLGMGSDGHTASLFPHTQALHEKDRWVVANEVPQHSTHRLTMTYPLLNRGRQVLFMVTGAQKSSTLREVLEGPSDPERLPSQRLQPTQGKLTWLVDTAAAAELSRRS